jgi:TolA-binding protein
MAHQGTHRLLAALILLVLGAAALPAQEGRSATDLQDGVALFKNAQYDKAIIIFRGVLLDSSPEAPKAEAYLWIAKSYLALGKLEDAARNVELLLAGSPASPDYPEALYQKGRILFLQEEYESSILVLQGFISRYPQSPFVPNAYFWVGECLYSLGRLDEASAIYRTIVRDYPTSFKVEASQYRISLIDIARREVQLSKLLKWSHEDFLKSMEDFQRREKTYAQAIESYQKKLSSNETAQYQAAIADLTKQLEKKTTEAGQLAAQVRDLKAAAASAGAAQAPQVTGTQQSASQVEAAGRVVRLLAIKQEALSLKASYLDWLERNGGAQ